MNKRILQATALAFFGVVGIVGCSGQGGSGGGCGANNNNSTMESKPNCGPGTIEQGGVCVIDNKSKK